MKIKKYKYEIGGGARDIIVVKSLFYKPEGRGFEIRRGEF
jgi:hypothetical protein